MPLKRHPLRAFLAFALVASMTTNIAARAADPLPRVLILGDSVYQQVAAETVKELKDRAEVISRPMQPTEICNTTTALEKLDEWLGEGKWDLIHFNFGLGDLVYRAPGMRAFRVMSKAAGGIRTTESEQYEKNLRELVKRLKATGARLIWASTTPITSPHTDRLFDPGSEIELNAIAARVMVENQIPINDMHAFVLAQVKENKDPSPFSFNRAPLHTPVVEMIRSGLGL